MAGQVWAGSQGRQRWASVDSCATGEKGQSFSLGARPWRPGLDPLPSTMPPHSFTPSGSPKAWNYFWLFLKEAFEAMSQFFPFLSLGIVYFGHLLFSMSCEWHCEASLSWTASSREQGGASFKNTSLLVSLLKIKPWGPFATAEPGNRASQGRKLAGWKMALGPRSSYPMDLLCDLGQLA